MPRQVIRPPSSSEYIMQPWKISIGFTADHLGAVTLQWSPEISFAYLKPHLRVMLTDHWIPIAWYGGLGRGFRGDG